MSRHPITRSLAVATSAVLLVTALAGSVVAKSENGPKADPGPSAERQVEKQAKA
jgi:hypothetical protein